MYLNHVSAYPLYLGHVRHPPPSFARPGRPRASPRRSSPAPRAPRRPPSPASSGAGRTPPSRRFARRSARPGIDSSSAAVPRPSSVDLPSAAPAHEAHARRAARGPPERLRRHARAGRGSWLTGPPSGRPTSSACSSPMASTSWWWAAWPSSSTGRLGSPRTWTSATRRSPANLEVLGQALIELDAKLFGIEEDVPFVPDAKTLQRTEILTLTTKHGKLDLLRSPSGAPPYPTLRARRGARAGRRLRDPRGLTRGPDRDEAERRPRKGPGGHRGARGDRGRQETELGADGLASAATFSTGLAVVPLDLALQRRGHQRPQRPQRGLASSA